MQFGVDNLSLGLKKRVGDNIEWEVCREAVEEVEEEVWGEVRDKVWNVVWDGVKLGGRF